jgi:hypothetical protein
MGESMGKKESKAALDVKLTFFEMKKVGTLSITKTAENVGY